MPCLHKRSIIINIHVFCFPHIHTQTHTQGRTHMRARHSHTLYARAQVRACTHARASRPVKFHFFTLSICPYSWNFGWNAGSSGCRIHTWSEVLTYQIFILSIYLFLFFFSDWSEFFSWKVKRTCMLLYVSTCYRIYHKSSDTLIPYHTYP